jgi:hypothetical protein
MLAIDVPGGAAHLGNFVNFFNDARPDAVKNIR